MRRFADMIRVPEERYAEYVEKHDNIWPAIVEMMRQANIVNFTIFHRDRYLFKLPRFAYWSMDEWEENKDKINTLRTVMQGWDITDFGSGKFDEIGAVLYTVRNGKVGQPNVGSLYAEKYLLFKENQRLPIHYHVCKTEDIINRGGGIMSIRLYNSKEDGSVDYESDVTYSSDGIMYTVKAGEEVLITTGNSIRLTPYIYHTFGAKNGYGPLIVGEVSAVNDDNTDNYFAEPVSRFADIEEDEPILYPLCNEYHILDAQKKWVTRKCPGAVYTRYIPKCNINHLMQSCCIRWLQYWKEKG